MNNKMKNEKYLQNMCRNIFLFRQQKGISLPELADATHLPLVLLHKLEKGIIPTSFTITQMFKICIFFHCSLTEIFMEPPK